MPTSTAIRAKTVRYGFVFVIDDDGHIGVLRFALGTVPPRYCALPESAVIRLLSENITTDLPVIVQEAMYAS